MIWWLVGLVVVALLVVFLSRAYWEASDQAELRRLVRLLGRGNVFTQEVFVPPGTKPIIEVYDYDEISGWGGRICLETTMSGETYAECTAQEGREVPNYEHCLLVNRQFLCQNERCRISPDDELILVTTPEGKTEQKVLYIKICTDDCPRLS